jgi:ferric-dicitrate binding protein FerR (iron transport regulator)
MENKKTNKKPLDNFANGDYSRSDYRRVSQMFSHPDDTLKDQMQHHWERIPADQALDDRMSRILRLLKMQTLISTQLIKRRSFINYYQKVAAVLLIPLLLGFGYWLLQTPVMQSQAMATIHSPMGARTEFVLPDGTSGWLNSGSDLSYCVDFSKNREVKLNGEAYFDVVHQQGARFRVKTAEITVQVWGTSFDVSAYEDDPQVNVILERGVVKVLNANEKNLYTMKPDEMFSYDIQKKKAAIRSVDAADQTSWTKGLLKFRGEPLSDVVKELARWYNVDFEIRDKQLREYNFKATFKDEELDEILRMISLTTPMKYRIVERKTNENGVYEKKKVIIEAN